MSRIHGDMLDRSFAFAVRILGVVDSLPNGTKGWLVAKQLARSGISIGANLHEADFAFSTIDFAHKCNVALKEAAETQYWLRLSKAAQLLSGADLDQLIAEVEELKRILTTIVRKTQNPTDRSDASDSF